MRDLTEIVVHCTATPNEWRPNDTTGEKVAEVRRWHVNDRGWSDIGYHFLIDRDGTVVSGRPLEKQGAHVRGHNKGTVGVSLFGGQTSSATDQFEDNYTPEQDAALRGLIGDLQAQYPTITTISGHNQYAAKACPGFNVMTWFAAVPKFLRGPAPAKIHAKPARPPKEVIDLIEDAERGGAESNTNIIAAIMGAVGAPGGVMAFVSDVDPKVMLAIVAGVTVLGVVYILRSRGRKSRKGRLARAAVQAMS